MRTELLLCCALLGCTDVENLANSRDASVPVDGERDAQLDAARDAQAAFDARSEVTFDAGVAICGTRLCQCSDGEDNDSDGLPDGLDPECTGPGDDFEQHFGTGVKNDDREGRCLDCFFDRNSGNDDGCSRPSYCTTGDTSGNNRCRGSDRCDVPANSICIQKCQPLVPNGCDCFGCCAVQGRAFHILLRDSCSLAAIDDQARCPRCTPSADCQNSCEACEVCPGRTLAELPVSCAPSARCGQLPPCDEQSDCAAAGGYCLQGCCLPFTDGI